MTPPDDKPTPAGSTPRDAVTRTSRETAAPTSLSLIVMTETDVVTYPLSSTGRIQIGRAAECEVILDDPQVSRFHAELVLGDGVQLRDRGSANGTFVGEERL